MTQEATPPLPDGLVEELQALLAKVGTLPLAESWMYQAIRHCERNMDFDLYDGDTGNEPDRQSGTAIAKILNRLPVILTALTPPAPVAGGDAELIARLRQGVILINHDGPGQTALFDTVTANQAMRKAADRLEALTQSSGACGAMIERCAKVADAHHKGLVGKGPCGRGSVNTARIIADEIRALKSAPAPGDEVERKLRALLAYVTGLPDDLRWTKEFTRYVNDTFNEIAALKEQQPSKGEG
jgi:hypothetical protein